MKQLYAICTLAFGLGFAGTAAAQCTVTAPNVSVNGMSITVSATGTGATQPAYVWDWGDQTSPGTMQNDAHTYTAAGTYTVCVVYADQANPFTCFDSACATVTITPSSIAESRIFKIEAGAYPSPFSTKTSIIFTTSHPSDVQIAIYDVLGKKVCDLYKDNVGAGEHSVDWNAVNVPAGLYFLHVKAGDITLNKKILKKQ